jgi:L-asparagine transporter-like permease
VLATTGSFVTMAQVSAVSRLVVYVATCGSALRLRSAAFDGRVADATFRVPLGPVIPLLAIGIALIILFGATGPQLRAGGYALLAGAALYLIAAKGRRSSG